MEWIMDFTDLMKRANRSYRDKAKKRSFGRCALCDDYKLLIKTDLEDADDELKVAELCQKCYDKYLNGEI